jgi:hypothetical protein
MGDTTQEPASLKHESSEAPEVSVDGADAPVADASESQPTQGTRVAIASQCRADHIAQLI